MCEYAKFLFEKIQNLPPPPFHHHLTQLDNAQKYSLCNSQDFEKVSATLDIVTIGEFLNYPLIVRLFGSG